MTGSWLICACISDALINTQFALCEAAPGGEGFDPAAWIPTRGGICPTLMTGNCAVNQADWQTTTETNQPGHKIITGSTNQLAPQIQSSGCKQSAFA